MQPVVLTITKVSSNRMHKTVVNTKSGTCILIKGKDELPNWLIDSTSQHDNPDKGTVQVMIGTRTIFLIVYFHLNQGLLKRSSLRIINVGHV